MTVGRLSGAHKNSPARPSWMNRTDNAPGYVGVSNAISFTQASYFFVLSSQSQPWKQSPKAVRLSPAIQNIWRLATIHGVSPRTCARVASSVKTADFQRSIRIDHVPMNVNGSTLVRQYPRTVIPAQARTTVS